MPKMLATALWPMAAAQIVATNNPIEVAARMIGREAPTAVGRHHAHQDQAQGDRPNDEDRQAQHGRVASQWRQ